MSLRARLLLLVLMATLLPAVLVGLRFLQERDRAIATASSDLVAAAGEIAADLELNVKATAQLLYGLARARDLATGDRAQCSAFLGEVLARHPQFTGILTITPSGQLFCDSLRSGRELDLRDRAYFRQVVTETDKAVLEPVFGRITGTAVLQIAYPVRDGDDLQSVLLASFNLQQFAEAQASRLVAGSQLLLVDNTGTVLTWLPAEQHRAQLGSSIAGSTLFRASVPATRDAPTRIVGLDGAQQVWGTGASEITRQAGLRVMVGLSEDDLTAAADERLRQDLTLLGILSLLLLMGSALVGEVSIRAQVERIAGLARRLGAGDLSARIQPPFPRGELGGLMSELNRTAGSLEQQRRNIDDLNRKLQQSQKMEAVGQLTGGVAHDFNNLLMVIQGNAEELNDALRNDPDKRALAEMIEMAASRGADLTRSLLAFSRQQPLNPKSVDVGVQLLRMKKLLQRTLGEHIECRFQLGEGTWPAIVDPAQLETAVLNLALNARDAMRGGGRLTIETGNARLDEAFAAGNEEVRPGDYVSVVVSDTGIGMPPEILAQVFEPFFTTKDVGEGTGLGLSMVYGFVKQSGGHIRIYSEPGQGTSVKIYLPRSTTVADEEDARDGHAVPGGGERILVVEDDAAVRSFVTRELQGLGYKVQTANNGAEALKILRGADPFDLMFTDVVMPGGLSGPQLAAQATALRPGLRLLYTSGYTENAIVHEGRLDAGIQLLSKPYRRVELARRVRAVLDEAPVRSA